MNPKQRTKNEERRTPRFAAVSVLSLCLLVTVEAYPPAPHHQFHGSVRDEYGSPINDPTAEVILETASGVEFKTTIFPGREPGENYRLEVPMDAGIAADLYKPTALRPQMPFQIKVVIAGVTYLPIEMSGDVSQLGRPGKRTLLNLTLGQDTDGDGLPDAWERLINPDISKVNPEDDSDGDKLSNRHEYLAGTYAFDPDDGFSLVIKRFNEGRPVIGFTVIRGRNYVIQGSENLDAWKTLSFSVGPAPTALQESYSATDIRQLEAEVHLAEGERLKFFRLQVR